MKLMTVLLAAVASLIITAPIRAETILEQIRITPNKVNDRLTIQAGGRFTIKVERVPQKDKGDFFDFQVKVKPKFLGGASVSVPGVAVTGGEQILSFRVAAKDLNSTFTHTDEFRTSGYVPIYWFYLKDFVPSK